MFRHSHTLTRAQTPMEKKKTKTKQKQQNNKTKQKQNKTKQTNKNCLSEILFLERAITKYITEEARIQSN